MDASLTEFVLLKIENNLAPPSWILPIFFSCYLCPAFFTYSLGSWGLLATRYTNTLQTRIKTNTTPSNMSLLFLWYIFFKWLWIVIVTISEQVMTMDLLWTWTEREKKKKWTWLFPSQQKLLIKRVFYRIYKYLLIFPLADRGGKRTAWHNCKQLFSEIEKKIRKDFFLVSEKKEQRVISEKYCEWFKCLPYILPFKIYLERKRKLKAKQSRERERIIDLFKKRREREFFSLKNKNVIFGPSLLYLRLD